MSTIVTRATKGSALTWTEGDANITNLNTDKLENVVQDTTPQLGGDLDVNGKQITSASNGTINLAPNGSGNIALTPTTGKIILGALDFPTGTGTSGQVLTTNGSSAMTWSTPSGGGSSTLDDLTDVVITAAASGDILRYNGTNWVDTAESTLAVNTANTAGVALLVQLTADNSTSANNYITFTNAATGNEDLRTDTGLLYNPSTGILAATQFNGIHNGAHNGTVGSTTASTGAFTTLSASSTVSGAGIQALFTQPTGIGATTPNTGSFTVLTARGATNSAKLTLDATNIQSTAWTNTGIGLRTLGATYTDSSSTGTIGENYINAIGAPILASTNITTVTQAATLYVGTAPAAGTNTTITNAYSVVANGRIKATDFVGTIGATSASSGTFLTTTVTGANDLRLNNTGNTFYVGFKAGTLTANKIWTLPTADGTTGQVLQTDGAGNLAWATAGGSSGNNIIKIASGDSPNFAMPSTSNAASTSTLVLRSTGGVSGVSVSTNTFTLPAGTYYLQLPQMWSTSTQGFSLYLRNVTDSTNSAFTISPVATNTTWGGQTNTNWWLSSHLGPFTIAATKTFRFTNVDNPAAAWNLRCSNGDLAFTFFKTA